MQQISIFGEVLFDCFPSGEKILGGAPFNVAWHLQAFGQRPLFISRVGDDAEGQQIRRAMQDWGMQTDRLQTDSQRATGEVRVSLQAGEPSYDIIEPVAYDFIEGEQLADQPSKLLYHGSLCLRHETSNAALDRLRSAGPHTIFMDVNLRSPWWRRDKVLEWVGQADWIKLNEAEFALLHEETDDLPASAAGFLRQYDLQGVVVTRGERGALVISGDQAPLEVAPVKALRVVDTVGAGDAFASVLLLGLNLNWSLRETLERAQAFASALVGQRGATVGEEAFYRPFMEAWGLA
jgi:fructokinase